MHHEKFLLGKSVVDEFSSIDPKAPLFWPTPPPHFSAFLELEYFLSVPAVLTLMWVHRGPPHHILTPPFWWTADTAG